MSAATTLNDDQKREAAMTDVAASKAALRAALAVLYRLDGGGGSVYNASPVSRLLGKAARLIDEAQRLAGVELPEAKQ